jgi:predicted dehydrogenase
MAMHFADTGFKVTALCDRNPDRMLEARTSIQREYASNGIEVAPRLYDKGPGLIADPSVELVVVTSITDTHREFVVPALQSGKKVYCDKPLAHNVEDGIAIVEAEAEAQNPLIMGFTRRYESAWVKAYELLCQDVIGNLIMLQVRNIIPYHRYLTAWWRRRAWSGGALNDKGCHLFDVFNWFTGSQAVRVHGFGGRSVIQPDPDAPSRCHLCYRDCPYRRREPETAVPSAPDLLVHAGPSWLQETDEKYMDDVCVYAPGSDLYHNGSIHFNYANGMIASYFYTIFGPPAKDEETLELVGTRGRLRLTRHTGELDIVTAYGKTHQVLDCQDEFFGDSHFGADVALVKELRRFCEGAPPTVSARAGLEATRMVMASFRSMDAGGITVDMGEVPDARL